MSWALASLWMRSNTIRFAISFICSISHFALSVCMRQEYNPAQHPRRPATSLIRVQCPTLPYGKLRWICLGWKRTRAQISAPLYYIVCALCAVWLHNSICVFIVNARAYTFHIRCDHNAREWHDCEWWPYSRVLRVCRTTMMVVGKWVGVSFSIKHDPRGCGFSA